MKNESCTSKDIESEILSGKRVLIDGYCLQTPQGTGIRSYIKGLLNALQSMGASTPLLTSFKLRKSQNINEILLFDEIHTSNSLIPNNKIIRLFATAKYTIKILFSNAEIVNIPSPNKILRLGGFLQDCDGITEIFNIEGCHLISQFYGSRINAHFKIDPPKKIDVWHQTYPLIPIDVKTRSKNCHIVTIYDTIPLKTPYFTRDRKDDYYKILKTVLKNCSVVTTISETSKQDILNFFDIDPSKIHVTYLPVSHTQWGSKLNNLETEKLNFIVQIILDSYGLVFNQYILFVGTIEPRKNLKRLLEAYLSIDSDFSLVVIGKKGWRWELELSILENSTSQNKKRIKFINYTSVEMLEYFYRGAYCLVFPSLYEGFGLPPLEAMLRNCPVIASETSSLPEVCGEAALYVDPLSTIDIRNKIQKLLQSSQERNRLIEKGKKQAQKFSFDNFKLRLSKVYSTFI